jgi:alkylation response protein AidB-like acyl-CoA dehydrogenase
VLIVPMATPGIEVREIPSVVGERYFHEVHFRDVRVPESARLGPEGEGWEVVGYALQYERVGAPRYARAARTLDRLAARLAAGGALAAAALEERLGEARALCEAARLLSYRVVDQRARRLRRAPTPTWRAWRGPSPSSGSASSASSCSAPRRCKRGPSPTPSSAWR